MQFKSFVISLKISILLCWANVVIYAQVDSVLEKNIVPNDNFYDRYLHKEQGVLSYDYIQERDVFQEKRIWREIDIQEKMNHHFNYEKAHLVNILIQAARKGEITLYHAFNDNFTNPMTPKETYNLGVSVDTVCTFDPNTYIEDYANMDTRFYENDCATVYSDLDPTDIKKYRLKEVWYFDEKTSSMGVRILGIAPIMNRYDDNGYFLNASPMFWAYYPDIRSMLAQHEVFNTGNDATPMSWEDIFETRFFSSYITKESNDHILERQMGKVKTNPLSYLLESQKIDQKNFNFEHDYWSY